MEEFVDVIAKGNIVEHSERSGRGGDEAVVGPVLVLVGVAELSGDDVLFMAQFEVVEEALELPHKVVDYHLAVQLSLLAVGGDGLSEH